jgi:hypothetical protein
MRTSVSTTMSPAIHDVEHSLGGKKSVTEHPGILCVYAPRHVNDSLVGSTDGENEESETDDFSLLSAAVKDDRAKSDSVERSAV